MNRDDAPAGADDLVYLAERTQIPEHRDIPEHLNRRYRRILERMYLDPGINSGQCIPWYNADQVHWRVRFELRASASSC